MGCSTGVSVLALAFGVGVDGSVLAFGVDCLGLAFGSAFGADRSGLLVDSFLLKKENRVPCPFAGGDFFGFMLRRASVKLAGNDLWTATTSI